MSARNYVVICRDDQGFCNGEYALTTRRLFTSEEAEKYAATIAEGRQAKIITAAEWLWMSWGK